MDCKNKKMHLVAMSTMALGVGHSSLSENPYHMLSWIKSILDLNIISKKISKATFPQRAPAFLLEHLRYYLSLEELFWYHLQSLDMLYPMNPRLVDYQGSRDNL